MVTAAIFALLVLLMMLGVPIAASMALTSILSFLALGGPDLLLMVPQRMYSGTTSFTLLAIPFFILAGNLMNTGGITARLILFAQCLVGHIRGGLGHVTVVTNMIMAGMSGAAVADAVGTGNILIPSMEKAGYPRVFSAALVGAASTIGPIIPPSIPFVIFGSMTGTSVGRLFLAGFVPGVLMGLLLMITIAIISKRRGYPRERRASLGELLRATVQAAPAWGSPLIIIGGILAGVFTPTEAAAVASVYALAVGMFVYREIRLADLPRILW
ncbi:MAG: transporter permease, partial [candidate division NC10 bacterium]|nr:transporter permease [candidate division NC10 bacterium]